MWAEDTVKMIRGAKALLIDEISMLDGHLFDVLECMVSIIRCYDDIKAIYGHSPQLSDEMLADRWSSDGLGDIDPWGGLQLIVVGDFFQLPPVPAGQDQLLSISDELDLKIGRQGCYAFESHAWLNSNFETVELIQVYRQAEDDGLFEFLNDVREGRINDLALKHGSVIESIQRPLPSRTDGIIPTELHSKNVVVDMRNREELNRINSEPYNFDSLDEVALDFDCYMKPFLLRHNLILVNLVPESERKRLSELMLSSDEKDKIQLSILAYNVIMRSCDVSKYVKARLENDMNELKQHCHENFFAKSCRVSEHFALKEEAQVMLLWNLNVRGGLANGSRGVVKGFFPTDGYLYLMKEEAKRRDEDETESERDRTNALGAGSNTDDNRGDTNRTPSNYDFSSVNEEILDEVKSEVQCHTDDGLKKEIKELEKMISSSMTELPFVQFANGRRLLIRPLSFSKTFRKCGTALRWQIPLTLAWAITIHKSQGMTIELLHVGEILFMCFVVAHVRFFNSPLFHLW
jgi:ATP-dependent DNA helicase PIF1